MVHGEQEHMFLMLEPEQLGADQRATTEIERLLCLIVRMAVNLGLLLLCGKVGQIHSGQEQRHSRSDDLDEPAIFHREACAQHLMTPDNFVQTPVQCKRVERTADAYSVD